MQSVLIGVVVAFLPSALTVAWLAAETRYVPLIFSQLDECPSCEYPEGTLGKFGDRNVR